MLKKLAFVLLIISLNLNVFAQYDYTSDCKKAYELIIDLRFDSAQTYINSVKKNQPENLIPLVLENYIDFLKISLSEDKDLFEKLNENKKIRIKQWENGSKDSPFYRMGIAQINMQWAFARVLFGEYFTAAFEINQAYHLLEENKILYPDFHPNAMGLGVLHAMIGVVPDQYQWAINFLGLYGSIDQGLNELEDLLHSDEESFQHYKAEALFLYTFLKLNLQNDDTRFAALQKEYQEETLNLISQRSPLLHFSRAVLMMKVDNDSAISFLEKRPQSSDAIPFYYPLYMLAQAKQYKLDPEANALFNDYIKEYPGNNFKRSAAQKEAWGAFIGGDITKYRKIMNDLIAYPSTKLDGDNAALKEAKKVQDGYLPNIFLLKSRILFDGGYLLKALAVLENAKDTDFNEFESIELDYRKARIYHHLDSISDAILFYRKAFSAGEKYDSYFAGNSALKLGEIYEQKKEEKQAEKYYQKCLTLDFDEYRKSIRAKAKAGLQRLK